jgi:hypothetical protein
MVRIAIRYCPGMTMLYFHSIHLAYIRPLQPEFLDLFLLQDRSIWHTCRSGPSPSSVRIRLSPFGAVTRTQPLIVLAARFITFSRRSTKQVAHGYFQARPEGEQTHTRTRQLSVAPEYRRLGLIRHSWTTSKMFLSTLQCLCGSVCAHRINWQ